MNKIDKAKVRVAIKMYLSLKPMATAKELATAINELDIGLYCDGVTANEIAKDILYSSKNSRNLLSDVESITENGNCKLNTKYYLGGK